MKAIIASVLALSMSSTAMGQIAYPNYGASPNYGALQQSFSQSQTYFPARGDGLTPATRKYRQNRVNVLRQEIVRMVNESGGNLSKKHRRIISEKAQAIINYTGSFSLSGPIPTS